MTRGQYYQQRSLARLLRSLFESSLFGYSDAFEDHDISELVELTLERDADIPKVKLHGSVLSLEISLLSGPVGVLP